MSFYDTIINPAPFHEPIHQVIESYCHPRQEINGSVDIPVPASTRRGKMVDSFTFRREGDRSGSFSKIKQSGVIKMTPYNFVNEKVTYDIGQFDRHSYTHVLAYNWSVCDCKLQVLVGGPVAGTATWTEQGDFSYWSQKYPSAPYYKATIDSNNNLVERSKLEAWTELISTYGLGEDLGELRETGEMALSLLSAARHPLDASARLLRDLRHGRTTFKRAQDAWLGYRYGIMPIAYSISDIHKLIKEKYNLYQTVHRTINGSLKQAVIPSSPPSAYFYDVINFGSITNRVTAKGHWESSALRTIGHVNVNPVSTAYELTRLSFVLDWFIDVNDYLTGFFGSFTSLAQQLQGCVSVRENYQVQTYLHLEVDERYVHNWSNYYGSCGVLTIPAGSYSTGDVVKKDLLLVTKEVNNYNRSLFSSTDLRPTLAPSLNWKRAVDGLFLSSRSLGNVFRAIRKII